MKWLRFAVQNTLRNRRRSLVTIAIAALGTAAILLAGGVALILLALRPPRDLFLWLSLALAAIAIGNVLTTFGGGRYTVGWYACRLSWLVSSGVLLLYFLGRFIRQEGALVRAADDLEERTRERDRI